MLTSLATPALVGLIAVTFGWIPSEETNPQRAKSGADSGYEYLVQLSPLDLEALQDGQANWVTSELPTEVGPIERVRIYVGTAQPPRRLREADASSPRRIAAKKQGDVYTVAKPVAPAWGDATLIPVKRQATPPQRRTSYQNPPPTLPNLGDDFERAYDGLGDSFEDLRRGAEGVVRDTGEALERANPFGNRPTQYNQAANPNYLATQPTQYEPATRVTPPEPTRRFPQSTPQSPALRDPAVVSQAPAARTDQQDRSLVRGTPDFRNERESTLATPFAAGNFENDRDDRRLVPISRESGRWTEPTRTRTDFQASNGRRDDWLTSPPVRTDGGFADLPETRPQADQRLGEFATPRTSETNVANNSRTAWANPPSEEETQTVPQQAAVAVPVSSGNDLAQLILIVASLGAAFFMWVTHMELRAKYRALLRTSPNSFQGRQAA